MCVCVCLCVHCSKMYVAFKNLLSSNHTFERFCIYEMEMNGLGEKKLLRDNLHGPVISMYYDRDSKTLFVSDQMSGNILSLNILSAEGLHSDFL